MNTGASAARGNESAQRIGAGLVTVSCRRSRCRRGDIHATHLTSIMIAVRRKTAHAIG